MTSAAPAPDRSTPLTSTSSAPLLDFGDAPEPIAIVGISCRFPGANSTEAFWQLMLNEVDAITDMPASRFDINAYYDPRPGTPGKIATRQGGFLDQIDQFDPTFFGISPREATRMDPQQRLLLEVAWEALEDAGVVPTSLAGSRTGVFVGLITNEYRDLLYQKLDNIDIYTITGCARSVVSGRISYAFGLEGPSVELDTACSSSLVSVHLACQSLRTGESDLALAGGVNLILQPDESIGYSQAKMLAPDGRCKFGDAGANGFVRSEGIGLVVLKRLSDALASGDPIYALIRGSAVNNDGATSGYLMTPSPLGQEIAARRAYAVAGIAPSTVHYIEAHGTGTSVGDPVELEALTRVMGEGRPADQPCRIGSVKTNIGHTEAAAGVAGLIKVALCLKHRTIPASLHVKEPNPAIPWDQIPVALQRTCTPWPETGTPARAGISSFGISGTNAHIVLEEAPQRPAAAPAQPEGTPHLFTLSAHSEEVLQLQARRYQGQFAGQPEQAIRDICFTAATRRAHHAYRLACTATSAAGLAETLQAFERGEAVPGLVTGRTHDDHQSSQRGPVFVFPGQGSQWIGMGRRLLAQEPVFRAAVEACEQAMRAFVDWSLVEQLTCAEGESRLQQIDVIQPTLFAIEVALAALWRSWGVAPAAVVGHSMGEVAAAYVAGILSLEDACRIICRRSQLLRRTSGQGAMAVVDLSIEQAQAALAGFEDKVSVAVSNSPTSTVLSGDPAALNSILEDLQGRDIFCRLVKVDVASHSPQMDPLRADLLEALAPLAPSAAGVPLYSTVTDQIGEGAAFGPNYWVHNLRDPVLFSSAVKRLLDDGFTTFIEMSPHPLLLTAIQQGFKHWGHTCMVLPSLRRDEDERSVLLTSLGNLYTTGFPIRWEGLYGPDARAAALPAYTWVRDRYWIEQPAGGPAHGALRGVQVAPLLGAPLQVASSSDTTIWELPLDKRALVYLDDHRVQETVILPGTAYVEMLLSAANQVFGPGTHDVTEIDYHKAMFLPDGSVPTVQVLLQPDVVGVLAFQVYSRPTGSQEPWTLHASGKLREAPSEAAKERTPLDLKQVQARCGEELAGAAFYEYHAETGNQWRGAFQGIARAWRRDGEGLALIEAPAVVAEQIDQNQFHPALLDACGQSLAITVPFLPLEQRESMFVLGSIGCVRVFGQPTPRMWSHAVRTHEERTDSLTGDVWVYSEDGALLATITDLRLQYLDPQNTEMPTEIDEWLYDVAWQEQPRAEAAAASLPSGAWLILADSGATAQQLQTLLAEQGGASVLAFPAEGFAAQGDDRYTVDPTDSAALARLFQSAFTEQKRRCAGIVHLWSLDVDAAEPASAAVLDEAQRLGVQSVVALVQSLSIASLADSPRLWIVTRGAQMASQEQPAAYAHTPLWGLGRVLFREYPALQCKLIDLDLQPAAGEVPALLAEIAAPDAEEQIALHQSGRRVARLRRSARASAAAAEPLMPVLVSGEQPFRLEIAEPGILDGLMLREFVRAPLQPGEVQVQVYAAGMNFRDVMLSMGVYPGHKGGFPPLGWECAGKVVAVGQDVSNVAVGDEVIAIAHPCMASFVTAQSNLVFPKPTNLSFEEAATVPIAYLTAYYAMCDLGRLRAGERVLIHSAAGGVGLAAVQIARHIGAEIFGTAGSAEKRAFLRSIGVAHALDSRSLAFADEIRQITNGQGIDMVLNSLAGEAIPRSLGLLRTYGRFLEIGKRDLFENSRLGLRPFEQALSYFAIDIARMVVERPEVIGQLMREILQHVAEGHFPPLPHQTYPVGQAIDAFRSMAQARHTGKLVLTMQHQQLAALPAQQGLDAIRGDASYLITGGLGGLGLKVAEWIARKGARSLILVGRTPLPPRSAWDAIVPGTRLAEQIAAVRGLEAQGVLVHLAALDVADEAQLQSYLAHFAQAGHPPLRGVIHAAGVVQFQPLSETTQDDLLKVLRSKVQGGWMLHHLLKSTPLDFFVLFSSASALLSSPFLGSYAAANAFLDGLAQARRAAGLPATSINWGFWEEVGMAAQQKESEGREIAPRGMGSFSPEQGIEVLERIMGRNPVQVAVMPAHWGVWGKAYPAAARSPLLAELVDQKSATAAKPEASSSQSLISLDTLVQTAPEERAPLVEQHVREIVSKVLGLSSSKLDPQQSLNRMGLDSLMAVELKNRIQQNLGIAVPVVKLLQGASIAQIIAQVLAQLPAPSSDVLDVEIDIDSDEATWEEVEL